MTKAKPKPKPDQRPMDEILEEKFRDWLTNGVPYLSIEERRSALQRNYDGSPKMRHLTRRRQPSPAEMRMMMTFFNRIAKPAAKEPGERRYVPVAKPPAKTLQDAARERMKLPPHEQTG